MIWWMLLGGGMALALAHAWRKMTGLVCYDEAQLTKLLNELVVSHTAQLKRERDRALEHNNLAARRMQAMTFEARRLTQKLADLRPELRAANETISLLEPFKGAIRKSHEVPRPEYPGDSGGPEGPSPSAGSDGKQQVPPVPERED